MRSLLSIQARKMKDPVAIAALEDAGKRMISMEVLYEKLYQSAGFSELPVSVFLHALIDAILSNFPGHENIALEKSFDDFILDAKRLQTLGVIINELLTNIMKYAFTGRNDGHILVSATLASNCVAIIVQDNGNGIPDSVNFENTTGFGLMLVYGLAKQLNGQIRIERGNGTRIVLEFGL